MPWFLGNSASVSFLFRDSWTGTGMIFLIVWSLALKGVALWHASRRNEKGWFIAILILNTVGVIEVIYLLLIAKVFDTVSVDSPKLITKKRASRASKKRTSKTRA